MSTSPSYRIVIPARYASQRLPGKPLLRIAGKTMLQHVYDCACNTTAADIIVATDDQRIADEANLFTQNVCMTSAAHPTGTDRISEVAEKFGWSDDVIVVNLQGDEPLMPPALVEQVARNLHNNPAASIATLCAPMTTQDAVDDVSNVKVVYDSNNMALYFSRAPIPYLREWPGPVPECVFRHIGLYAYRVAFLRAYQKMPLCELEQIEKLEQLRALWNGYKIHVDQALQLPGQDVNTESDLRIVESLIASSENG